MSLVPGTRLGSYEIVRALGQGGMGEVYLARDTDLNRTVAIKVLPPDVTADPHRVARFEQEARAASALNHPNVCTIHALGRTEDRRRFIAMEFIEGETLRARLGRGRLSIHDALDIAMQIASALTAAHASGIVHRDIKPENVMMRADRLVKVLDFGLAKLTPSGMALAAHEPTRTMAATDPGSLVGTVGYMSPEQARGTDVDARTDIWALGVVLYEMVSGRAPFSGTTRSDVLVAILDREPAALTQHQPQVPPELQRIVGKALRKDPEERYQVMKDLLLDLKALRGELVASSSSGASVVVPTRAQRTSARWLALGVVALIALVSAGAWWWTRRTAPEPASTFVNRPLTRLTFGPGLQTDPTFSPDGRFIAYASDRSGNFDIWVQPIGGGDAVQVTRSSEHDTQPAWSPDGTTLVFRSERDGGALFTIPALGGNERQLASFGAHPMWTADSREVLFVAGAVPGEGLWPMRLHRVALDGSPPREVLRDFLAGGSWFWIAPHPDGRRISAWGAHERHGDGFFTVTLDGKDITASRIATEVPFQLVTNSRRRRFQWHPQGTALFVQADTSNVYNLWKINVKAQDLAWTSIERLTTGAGADVLGALSSDARRLVFGTHSESSRLWLFELGPTRLGTPRALTEQGSEATYGTLSKDGAYVAYVLGRQGTTREETWVAPVAGGAPELITTGGDSPVWSPDGRALVYSYLRVEGARVAGTRIVIRNLRGGERPASQQLTDRYFFPKQWTQSGWLLGVYGVPVPGHPEGDATRVALWPTMRRDAKEPERVLASHPSGSLWQPSISPNERWLVFVVHRWRDTPDKLGMFLAPAAGAPPERWTRLAADHAWPDKPRWARDGRTLYFISQRPSAYFNVWALRFDPDRGVPVGEPFPLTSFDSPSLYISPYLERAEMDVSARHIMLTMRSVAGSIWMLEGMDR
jgi:serine/threonine protein kinase/Tol biopolymer transport system component